MQNKCGLYAVWTLSYSSNSCKQTENVKQRKKQIKFHNCFYQGSCGSCWAFATVEQVESYAALNNITVDELSTQEVIDNDIILKKS